MSPDDLPTTPASGAWSGFTVRSFAIGLLLVGVINVISPYAAFVMHTTHMTTNYFPLGLVFPFFILVAVVNVGLKLVRRSWALRPNELILSFIMGLVACAVPTYGVTGYLLSTLAAPFYHASPENRWAETFHEFIPNWICPRDEQAMVWFFEGIPKGVAVPWSAWVRPLFWWIPLIFAVFFLCLCIIVILRRQWQEKERLVYPLAEVPEDMVRNSDDNRLLPEFMRARLFWIGFMLAFGIVMWNIVSYFNPQFPRFALDFGYISFGKGFPGVRTKIYPPMMGIAFLLHLNVSFSVWFFVMLGKLQIGVFNRIGYTIGRGDCYCSHPASMAWQGWGAFMVMVLVGLWLARAQIRDVFGKAFGTRPHVDDSREILSYRTATFGAMISLVYIIGWMRVSGMDFRVIALFLFAAIIAYIGLARIVVEGGLVFLRPPLIPQAFAVYTLGASTITPTCMTAIGFTYAWYCDIISAFIPLGANAAKLGHTHRIGRKAMFLAIVSAMLLGFLVSLWYTIFLAYRTGAYNFTEWVFGRGALQPFNNVVSKLRNPVDMDWNRLMFLGVGAVGMLALISLNHTIAWWPLHPIGFPLSAVGQVVWCMFSVFAGWLAKFFVMKLGGMQLYKQVKPFFIGIILGYFFGSGVSAFVDLIWFPGEGHMLYL